MNSINLLDCTLRDGGYINDWRFGEKAIKDIKDNIEQTGVDVIELGFMRNEPYQRDRVVFNSVDQVKNLIGKKRPGTMYAVMCEVANPMPLDMLAPADKEGPDIIRVIVWKTKHDKSGQEVDALDEGFVYCKGIVEKGYRLCVQPARVDQYSDEEFVSMVRRFSQLDPMAIYVVDSWGTQNAEGLLHYMHLADANMPPQITLGYHGHNNMMQAFGVAQAMLKEGFDRSVMIDASVYGIGRGAGNLDLKEVMYYLNNNYLKYYIVPPIDVVSNQYILGIYAIEHWGYSEAYYLSAQSNCNPAYARYFDGILHLPTKEIQAIFDGMSEDERILYSERMANKVYRRFRRNLWKKRLAIIILTANRAECIHDYLEKKSREYSLFGIDLIIFDSSSNDSTESITKKYTEYEGSTTIYEHYDGEFDGVSLDHKLISAYQQFAKNYDYIWACRDGLLIDIWNLNEDLYDLLEKKSDVVIVYDSWQNIGGFPKISHYDSSAEILDDHCKHMTILGTSIVSSQFVQNVIQEEPIDSLNNYGMWQPIAFFHYWARYKPNALCYVNSMFSTNAHGTPSSFWNKKGIALWQWGRRWYEMIHSLPECYDPMKERAYKIGMRDFTPFASKQLVILRANGSLTIKNYKDNAKYLAYTTDTKPWRFKAVCMLPRRLCQFFLDHPESAARKIMKKSYLTCKAVYRKLFPYPVVEQLPLYYELGRKKYSIDTTLKDCKFGNRQLCILIPTANRAAVIEDHLYSCMQLYRSFGVDIIVYDSSDGNETETVVKKWQQIYGESLKYDRWRGVFDGKSIDQKVMDCYSTYADQYEYVWIQRDRLGIDLNACAAKLLKILNKKPDIVIVHQFSGKIGEKEYYTDSGELFRDCFSPMTVLGQCIVKGAFIRETLREEKLSDETYSLWQPIAFFRYIARHDFSAATCISECFVYHPNALKGSFWKKTCLWQFVGRIHKLFESLPSVYEKYFYDVLLEWNENFPLFFYSTLLDIKLDGGLTKEEVNHYRDIIPLVTYTPVRYFDEIANMSNRKAKRLFEHRTNVEVQRHFSDTDHSQLGNIKTKG